jgi:hypothetical protein
MASVTWARVGAATGSVFVLLFVAAQGVAVTETPEIGLVPPGDIVAFVEANRLRLGLVPIARVLAWSAFIWFMGSLRSALAETEGSPYRLSAVTFGSGILVAGLFIAASALQLEIVFGDWSTTDPDAVNARWAIYDVSDGYIGVTPFIRAVLLGSASLITLRHGGLPRWLGWVGIVAGVVNFMGGFEYVAPEGVSITGHQLSDLFTFLAWIMVASIVLVRSPYEHARPPVAD